MPFARRLSRSPGVSMHAYRTHNCNTLTAADVGREVRISGWVHRKRDHGQLLFDGDLARLQARYGSHRELHVEFSEPVGDARVPDLTLLSSDSGRATYAFTGPAADPIARVTAHAPVRDLTVREPDIEATIRRIYEGDLLRAGVGSGA